MEWLSQRCPLPPAAQGCPRPGRGTVLLVLTLSLLMYPVLRSLVLQLHSAITGSYISGTHSIAFINCLNEQIARDIARLTQDALQALNASNWLHMVRTNNPEPLQMPLLPTHGPTEPSERAIMEKKLAAYVNILPKSSALYFWKGELEESTEILLLVKTRTSKIGELSDYVRSIHPFEIPDIISLPVDQGNPLYLKWIEESVPRD